MVEEPCDALWPDDDRQRLALRELAEVSGLTESELHELVEYGALTPAEPVEGQWVFSMTSITVARTASRLRAEFELEPHGVAVLLAFLERIHELEARLRDAEARLPR